MKRVVRARRPSSPSDLEQICQEERAIITPKRIRKLLRGYLKRLDEVIKAKGGQTQSLRNFIS